MPLYKDWNDFDSLRDKNKVLVIYGAGANGRRFLEHNKIVPDYFCDKSAKQIKNVVEGGKVYKCLTLKSLLKELNGRDADILVSNLDEKVIKKIYEILIRTNFTEKTVIYFRYDYDISKKKIINDNDPYGFYKINNILNRELCIQHLERLKKDIDYYTILKSLKNAYFNSRYSSIEELEKSLENIHKRTIENFRSKRLWERLGINIPISRNDVKEIYFFCDSRINVGFNIIKKILEENTNYRIENHSLPGLQDEQVIFVLTSNPLVRNSIVIINRILNPYLLLIAKEYCRKYNCRLVYYYIPYIGIIHRKVLTDYEKWCVEISGLNSNDSLSQESVKRKIKFVAKAMNVEFYEPSEEFFNSDKTIFIDYNHFGDYGAEIIAKHLCEIITSQSINPNNDICEDFHIEPEEKIEYANSVILLFVPDLPIYLNDLKKHKQNFENCGAIVMNCNPFTLGHRYLIEYAASEAEHLYIFVVEEDKSEFSFKDRYKLVKQNTSDLKNVTVLPSGKFIISSQTFDAYFGKSSVPEEQAVEQDVSFDLLIFAAAIAPTLNIKTRFVGQEPFDPLTRHYNEEMKKLLPEYGCDVVEIPRLEKDSGAVSASRVRKFLKEGNFEEIRKIVPEATFRYLRKNRGNPKA